MPSHRILGALAGALVAYVVPGSSSLFESGYRGSADGIPSSALNSFGSGRRIQCSLRRSGVSRRQRSVARGGRGDSYSPGWVGARAQISARRPAPPAKSAPRSHERPRTPGPAPGGLTDPPRLSRLALRRA